jgi:type IV pilus assembly protein PilO
MSFFDDLRNLDRNNIGGWPKPVKFFFAGCIAAVILVLGWYWQISGQQDDLDRARTKETALKKEFAEKQAKAVNLDAYRKQLDDMQEMLQAMLRHLPSKTEIPELLNDVTQAAQAAGIETEMFQPGAESIKDFYAEKPIQIKMLGAYHQFGAFISNVASLPRVVILTMHDVSLKAANKPSGTSGAAGNQLMLEGTVKTYRYLDDAEVAENQRKAAEANKGKKPAPKAPAKGGE